ncbi:MAG: seg [Candidatus Taylorbacteria bacterium]|nr:seg [Candidatus Taylorbacteria bacterium]
MCRYSDRTLIFLGQKMKILNQKVKDKSKKQKLNSGFTLIEIMVAVTIFALVMVVAIGAVLSIVSANKKSQAITSVLSNLNFALEAMVRDMRTGYDYHCSGASGGGGDCPGGGTSLSFTSTQSGNKPVIYVLDDTKGAITKSVDGGAVQSLTSGEVKIDALNFYLTGTGKTNTGDYDQPRIIIIVKGHYQGFGDLTEFHLQTMVSQRRIDI